MSHIRNIFHSSHLSCPYLCGIIAVMTWCFGAFFVCFLQKMPVLQLVSLSQLLGGYLCMKIYGRSFSISSCLERIKRGWPLLILLIVNQLGYVVAFRSAPVAQVDLIYYTWPIFLFLGKTYQESQSLTLEKVAGVGIGFLGIVFLVLPDMMQESFSLEFLSGYLVAFFAGLGWVLYSISIQKQGKQTGKDSCIGEDLVLIGIFGAILHSVTGQWVAFSSMEFLVFMMFAVLVYGCAYPLWKKAMMSEEGVSVSGYANLIPIGSVMILGVTGFAEITGWVLLAGGMVTLGCYILTSRGEIDVLGLPTEECIREQLESVQSEVFCFNQ